MNKEIDEILEILEGYVVDAAIKIDTDVMTFKEGESYALKAHTQAKQAIETYFKKEKLQLLKAVEESVLGAVMIGDIFNSDLFTSYQIILFDGNTEVLRTPIRDKDIPLTENGELSKEELWERSGTAPSEDTCQRCISPNPVWFAPNELWNKVMRHPDDKEADEKYNFICPNCFIDEAEFLGIEAVWELKAEQVGRSKPSGEHSAKTIASPLIIKSIKELGAKL